MKSFITFGTIICKSSGTIYMHDTYYMYVCIENTDSFQNYSNGG